MNDAILVTLIGTVGVIVGAILSFLATYFTSKQKLKELEITYRQKRDENRLANARMHIDTVYLPINICLSRLAEKYEYYQSYRRSYETSKTALEILSDAKEREIFIQISHKEYAGLLKTRQDFILACNAYLDLMSEVANQGNDTYLIIKLEERLRLFTTFIQTFMISETFKEDFEDVFKKEDKAYERYLALAGSLGFTQRFERDIHDLKSYIKDVSL